MKKKTKISLLILLLPVISIAGTTLIFKVQNKSNLESKESLPVTKTKMSDKKIDNSLQQIGVQVIQPNDFAFKVELTKHVGGNLSAVRLVETASPQVMFIRNNSTKDIIGVSLRWVFFRQDGTQQVFPQTISTPGKLMGIKPVDPWLVGKTSLININDIRLFSFFDIVRQEIKNVHDDVFYPGKNAPITESVLKEDISFVEFKKTEIKNFVNSTVFIDGILFSNGEFIGENKNFFFESITGAIMARMAFRQSLKEARLAGKNEAETLEAIKEELYRTTNPEPPPPFTDGKTTFELSYKNNLYSLKVESQRKRKKSSDKYIIDGFLEASDKEIILPRKVN